MEPTPSNQDHLHGIYFEDVVLFPVTAVPPGGASAFGFMGERHDPPKFNLAVGLDEDEFDLGVVEEGVQAVRVGCRGDPVRIEC